MFSDFGDSYRIYRACELVVNIHSIYVNFGTAFFELEMTPPAPFRTFVQRKPNSWNSSILVIPSVPKPDTKSTYANKESRKKKPLSIHPTLLAILVGWFFFQYNYNDYDNDNDVVFMVIVIRLRWIALLKVCFIICVNCVTYTGSFLTGVFWCWWPLLAPIRTWKRQMVNQNSKWDLGSPRDRLPSYLHTVS